MKRVLPLAFAALLLLGFMLPLLGGVGAGTADAGARSAGRLGKLGLVLLLKDLGFEIGIFEAPPGELHVAEVDLLVMPVPPESDLENDVPHAHRLGWYRHFVECGGDLVVFVEQDEDLVFLREDLGVDSGQVVLDLVEYDEEPEVLLAGERFVLGRSDGESAVLLDVVTSDTGRAQVELISAEGSGTSGHFGAIIRQGQGRIVVLMGAPFGNLSLVEGDNSVLFIRLLEYLGRDKVFFDEWAVGGRAPVNWFSGLFRRPLLPATMISLVVLGLCLWNLATRRQFVLQLPSEVSPSTSLRAHALANLMARAGHTDYPPSEGSSHDR